MRFGIEYHVKFNPQKTKHMYIGNTKQCSRLYLDGKPIDLVDHFEHLGNIIEFNRNGNDVNNSVRKFQTDVNMIMAQFGNVFPETRYKLFKMYCMSLYGCQLWDFSSKEVNSFYTAWRKAVRFVWKIPYNSHCNLLHFICDDLPVEVQMHKRFVKFFHKILNSDNCLVHACGVLALEGSRSPACNSLNAILPQYNLNKYTFYRHNLNFSIRKIYFSVLGESYDDTKSTAILIRELCQARDGQLSTIMTRPEIVESIFELCTM